MGQRCEKPFELKPLVETVTITRMTVLKSCVKGSRFITLLATNQNDEEILLKGNASGKQFMKILNAISTGDEIKVRKSAAPIANDFPTEQLCYRLKQMPKFNSKMIKSGVEAELTKWRGRSRVSKTSNHISYGKIKAALVQMEKKGTKQELNQLSSYIENQIEIIWSNVSSCLQALEEDLENLRPKKKVPRKKESQKSTRPEKRRKMSPFIDDEAEEASEESDPETESESSEEDQSLADSPAHTSGADE